MGAVMTDRAARFVDLTARESAMLEELGQRLSEGEHLPGICKAWDVPYWRVLTWLMADAKRYDVYQRALEVAAHALVSETVGIADGDGYPQNKRIRIETRFKVAGYHAPEVYGRREEAMPNTVVLVSANLERVADALLERLGGRTIEQPQLVEESTDGDI
jgi:hypothetical protein